MNPKIIVIWIAVVIGVVAMGFITKDPFATFLYSIYALIIAVMASVVLQFLYVT